jgi:subtilisin family serine protease
MTLSVFIRRSAAAIFLLSATACHQQSQDQTAQPHPPPPDTNAPATNAAAAAESKRKITKLDDLPRHTYKIDEPASVLVTDDAKFPAFAAQVRADTESDLANYDIADKTTLKSLKGTLLTLDLLEGKNDDARALVAELQGLEDKPAEKIMTGFTVLTRLDVEQQMGITNLADLSRPDFQQALEKELEARANKLPYNLVQADLKETKGGFEIVSRAFVLGRIQSSIDPVVKQTGVVSNDIAGGLVHARASLLISVPLKAPIVSAFGAVIAAHNVAKADIWAARDVTLTKADQPAPVVIGIWDSGVDPKVYPDKLFTDPDYGQPGDLTDKHGFAYDLHSNLVHGELYPLGDKAAQFAQLRSQIKGMLDIEASVDSPEAAALKKKLSTLKADQVKAFMEDLELFGNFMHGTHVAGIASKGNPAAKLLIGRITFDYHVIPEKPTIEQAKKDVIADQAAIDYLKAHHVRAVNMSWGGSLKDVEDALEQNGVSDADERKKEAREIFDLGRDGLYNALKSAPDILFIVSAGNSDNDVDFDEMVPSSFDLPNMITVGAVDQAGDETSFTSFGKNVAAYADGFEVDSPIPGGTHLKLSGTSMASPEVTNLAAKLFALDPKLTPTDVKKLIVDNLDANPNDPRIHLLNPKKSVEALRAQKAATP